MSRSSAPIVAELGRPETADETAARKAASSQAYRSSQTVRHLVAALLLTLAVVLVIVFAVPRGEPAAGPEIDLDAVAANVSDTMQRDVVIPDVADGWRVNRAELDSGATSVWDVTMAPSAEDARGFVHVAQAFDADAGWAPQALGGTAPTDTVEIAGRTWDVFTIADPSRSKNISSALGTQAGGDYVLVYGALSADATAELASQLSPQIDAIEEAG